jgi:hypothetical protein
MVRRPSSTPAVLALTLGATFLPLAPSAPTGGPGLHLPDRIVDWTAPGPTAAAAQEEEAWRFGISVGGVSTVGLVLERIGDWGRVEVLLGTWGFRDISLSTVYKNTIGGGDLRAVAGLGLWTVLAFPRDERTGLALVARAPVGFEWQFQPDHFMGAELGFSRALAIRRTDPEDLTPPARRIVPLPGASYRWRH